MKTIKTIFFIISTAFFIYFVAGQIILPTDSLDLRNVCFEYEEDWYIVNPDGSRQLTEIPGKCGEHVVIETTLPDNIDSHVTSLFFRGEDLRAYVGDELRQEYSTEKTRWFGIRSPESYICIPISYKDEGKTLRIEMDTNIGILYNTYVGSELGLWIHILNLYMGELVVAVVTLVLGVLTVIVSFSLRIKFKKTIELAYLGYGITFAAIWLIVNSVFRQILFSNVSVANDLPFMMVMILPYPFLIYINEIQERRYTKLYALATALMTTVIVYCWTLYILGIKDLHDTFVIVAISCLISISLIGVTFVIDIKNKFIKKYYFVAIGILGAVVSASVQLVMYFGRKGVFRGSVLAVGLIVLLVCSVINTIRNFLLIEREKQAAVLQSNAKGTFLANMSHEIRTPINAVLGMNEMILRETRQSNIREYAMDIQNAGKSLLSLINDILDISKIESRKMEIIPVEYDFSSMIHDVVNMIGLKAKTKNLNMDISIDNSLPSRLFGDDLRIRQVITNILNNAVKYTQKGGITFTVSGESYNDIVKLRFSVKDTGIGIKEEDIPKLFNQYERIEEGRNKNIEGTGLGISIVVRLLKLMGSELMVESTYGVGSHFYFDIEQKIINSEPISNLDERIKKQADEYNYRVSFIASKACVLIVDDNAVNRKVFKQYLKDTKLMIDEAESGEACVDMVKKKKYDMIFLDHMMPGMDGIETLHVIRGMEDGLNRDTKIVALTANAVFGAKEMYIKEGFDGFLSKPIVSDKLEKYLLDYLPKEKINYVDKQEVYYEENRNSTCVDSILEKLPEINLDYALQHNKDEDELLEVIEDFIKLIESEATDLEKYFSRINEGDNLKQYRVKVHSMKGSAAMIGAMHLSGAARMLELAAINEDYETINSVTPSFLKMWRQYKENLKPVDDYFSALESKEDSDKLNFNKELLLEQLNMLYDSIKDMDIDRADEIVSILKEFNYEGEISGLMDEVYSAVESISIEKLSDAFSQIKKLCE